MADTRSATAATIPTELGDKIAPTPAPQFFIPAVASLEERRPRVLKHDDMFMLCDHNGDLVNGPSSPEGLYHKDTRYLSLSYLSINKVRPILLSSSLRDDNAALVCDLSNPDLLDADGARLVKHDRIHIRRVRLLHNAAAHERMAIRNFDDGVRTVRLTLHFACDFADLFEVRGAVRAQRGRMHEPSLEGDAVLLAYTGLDGVERKTRIRFSPKPAVFAADHVEYTIELAPGERRILFIEVACNPGPAAEDPPRAFFRAMRDARRESGKLRRMAASVATSNEIFNEAVRQNVADLYMLTTKTEDGPYPYAGIPWFSTVFGRDAIITALQTLWLDPAIARGVLKHLAALQATAIDAVSDAEPGKILHELRYGEMAELNEVPFRRYYGSVDSTPLFIMLAGAYLERTDDMDLVRGLWPNIQAALNWIDEYGDRDRDGFIEYFRQTPSGLANQGWKDSYDSVSHADGTLAEGPIALVEVQAYVYGAWRAAATIQRRLGNDKDAEAFEARAQKLRDAFDTTFFDAELGTFILALDGEKRPCRVRASNAGHALFTGIARPERASAVVRTLMDSFTGFGVRTLAAEEVRYNPMSYHNGSVWPHDNALIAAGFASYGYRAEAAKIFGGLFAASTYTDLRRLPELFCGFPRQRNSGPVFYPVACSPQAWSTATPFMLLQACLGLSFAPRERQITFCDPALPEFLDTVQLCGLKLGAHVADVTLRRAGDEVVVHAHKRSGDCRVVTTV